MIGLTTPLSVPNYGTKLQAYAMQELIESLGFPVELINYHSQFDFRPRVVAKKVFSWQKTQQRIEQRLTLQKYKRTPGLFEKVLTRWAAMDSFEKLLRKSIPIRGFSALHEHASQYAAVVCGSDQIWLPVHLNAEFYTLEFAPENVRRISFAPSFGISSIPPSLRSRYSKFLSRLHHISVREESGRQIIRELTGKDVPVVLDPTLALDPERWVNLAATSTAKRPNGYIFCYFLGSNPDHRQAATKLGQDLKLQVVGLPHLEEFVPADSSFADINLFDVTPADFVHLIQNADLVCTDSFHGTAFSIIFKKNFVTFERFRSSSPLSTNSRIHSLLDKLNLRDRLATDVASATLIASNSIDHNRTQLILESLRNSSRQFLGNALSSSPSLPASK